MNKFSRKFLSVLLALCMVLGMLPGVAWAAESAPFPDVDESDWFYRDVQYVYENKLMDGTGGGFSPGEATSRGMMVTLLYRLEGSPAVSAAAFTDVPDAEWYAPAVAWASANRIVDGYGNGRFGPLDPISRQDMAVILYRYCQAKGYQTNPSAGLSAFSDADSVSDYAREAMGWAVANGIFSGEGGALLPARGAIRAEAAAVIARFHKDVALPGQALQDQPVTDPGQEAEEEPEKEPETKPEEKPSVSSKPSATPSYPGYPSNPNPPTTTPERKAITSVSILANGNAVRGSVQAGDTLTVKILPEEAEASCSIVWTVSGVEFSASSYIVGDDDSGAVISVTVTGSGTFLGSSKTDSVTVEDGRPGKNSVALEGVSFQTANGSPIQSGDTVDFGTVLSVTTTPAGATCDITWNGARGGKTFTAAEGPITVIVAGVKADGEPVSYTATFQVSGSGAAFRTEDQASPVPAPVMVLEDESVTFQDEDGNTVDITEATDVSVVITPAVSTDESGMLGEAQNAEAKKAEMASALKVAAAITGNGASDYDTLVSGAEVTYTAVEVALQATITTTETDAESGEETTTEATKTLHPVGATIVTLTAGDLGLTGAIDLHDYVFFANHTNQKGEEESVPGTVVTINGVDCVQFVLNGLSRIYIGNVPPQPVRFYRYEGGDLLSEQLVKFGGFAADVDAPTRDGYIFTGWDHDIQTENIIKSINVYGLWVVGQTAGEDQIQEVWYQDNAPLNGTGYPMPENIQRTFANGAVTLTLDGDAVYDPNLSIRVILDSDPAYGVPADAAYYTTGSTAEGASLSTKYSPVNGAGALSGPAIEQAVTNASGKAVTSNTNLYVKWVDENYRPLLLQSVRLLVRTTTSAPGNYDTQTRMETVGVDRGLGRVAFYLTGGTAEDRGGTVHSLPDYTGTIQGYLRGHNNRPGEDIPYVLDLYASFGMNFGYFVDSTDDSYILYGDGNYTGIRIEITPFAGRSFRGAPSASAYYTQNNSSGQDTRVDVPVTATLNANGGITLTCEKPELDAYSRVLTFTVTEDGQTQNLQVHLDNYNYRNGDNPTYAEVEAWADAVAAIKDGNTYVVYTGTETAVLNEQLIVQPDQQLELSRASLRIAQGGELQLQGSGDEAAHLIVNGSLTVANGGVLSTNAQDSAQARFYIPSVYVPTAALTVESGGRLYVPAYGEFSLQSAGMRLNNGGTIQVAGNLHISRNVDNGELGENVFAGKLLIESGSSGTGYYRWAAVDVNDKLTVTETGTVDVGDSCYLSVYGGLINNGTATSSGQINLSGRSENYGTIAISGSSSTGYDNAYISMQNTGYSVYNEGKINVTGSAYISVQGTVLNNAGSITGDGTIYTGDMNDVSSYDNGLEWVTVSGQPYPNNYSHYEFVRDPSSTVDVIYFLGELKNVGSGSCTLTVNQ